MTKETFLREEIIWEKKKFYEKKKKSSNEKKEKNVFQKEMKNPPECKTMKEIKAALCER